ncbi:MAG: hypothetical protein HYT94_05340 [Parcubacteria group bacterium]|nr:hypothetical protein [Parcubacteria group bacterium]
MCKTELEHAEVSFHETVHGSSGEQKALERWRGLCTEEYEGFVAVSAYQRRQATTKAAKKKIARRKHEQ